MLVTNQCRSRILCVCYRSVLSGRTVLRAEEGGADTVGTDVPFELRGFSLATIGLGLGGVITVGSFAEVRRSVGCVCMGKRSGRV